MSDGRIVIEVKRTDPRSGGSTIGGRCDKKVDGRRAPCNRLAFWRCSWQGYGKSTPSVRRCEAHKVEVGHEVTL